MPNTFDLFQAHKASVRGGQTPVTPPAVAGSRLGGSTFESFQAHKQIVRETGEPLPSVRKPIEPVEIVQPPPKRKTLLRKSIDIVKTINLKKIGQSILGGARQFPAQISQGGGVILQGLVSQQKALDFFYKRVPFVSALPGISPIFTLSAARTLIPKKIVKKGDVELELIAREFRRTGTMVSEKARKQHFDTFEPSKGLQGYIEMAAFNLPQLAANAGLSIATGLVTRNPALATAVGLSTSYGLGASEVYDEARSSGLSDEEALPLAQIGGAIIGAIDFLPLGRLIKKIGVVKAVKKSIIKKVASGLVSLGAHAGFVGITEGAEQVIGNAIAQTYDENKKLFSGVKEAVIVGILLGGFIDVTVSGIIGLLSKKADPGDVVNNIEKKINKAISKNPGKRTKAESQIVQALFTSEMTPDQVASYVIENDLGKTTEGKAMMKIVLQAKQENNNIRISLNEDESSIRAEIIEPGADVSPVPVTPTQVAKKVTKKPAKPTKKREVIKLEKRPAGVKSAIATIKPDGTAGLVVEIDKKARGKKIGSGVVRRLENKLIAKGIREVSINAFIETKGFWEKQGYSVVKGAKEKQGMIKMEKTLQKVKKIQQRKIKGEAKVKPKKVEKPKKAKEKVETTRKPPKKKETKAEKGGKQVLTQEKRKQIQEITRKIVLSGDTPQQTVNNIDKFLNVILSRPEVPGFDKRVKAVGAEMKRQMYDIVGADTGNFKRDYTFFLKNRHTPEISEVVDRLEDGIFEIDERINTGAPAVLGEASTGTRPIGEFKIRDTPKKGTEEFKLFEKVKALTKKYAERIGENYLPRGALGFYHDKTNNIRIDSINNLSTAAHEITHFLDTKFHITEPLLANKGFTKSGKPIYDSSTFKYRKALTDLYVTYYPTGKKSHKLRARAREGFATLLQKYIEMPKTIEQEYPLLVRAFLKPSGRFYKPVMGEILYDLNEIIKDYQGLPALDKIGAVVTSDNIKMDKDSFLSLRDKIRTELVDSIYPIEVLAEKSGKSFTKADPSLWLRSYNNVAGVINQNFTGNRGFWSYKEKGIKKVLDFNWKDLVDTLDVHSDPFGNYLVARQQHFAYLEVDAAKEALDKAIKEEKKAKGEDKKEARILRKGIETHYKELKQILKNDGFSREVIDEAYKDNKARFVKEEEMFDKLTHEDFKFLASDPVQLITNDQFNKLSSKQGYASLKRQFYDEILGDSGEFPMQITVGGTKVSSTLRRKGSAKTIVNPLYSGMANHSEIMRKGLKQIVYNRLTDIGTSAVFPELFQELQLQALPDPRTGAILFPQERDPNIIMGRKDGKRVPVLVDKGLKAAVDGILTYRNIDIFEKIYTGMSRAFTAGTTGFYPQFIATNFAVDQISAMVNSRNQYKAIYSPLVQFSKILKDKQSVDYKFYEEYLVAGGERHTLTGWQKLSPRDMFRKVKGEREGLARVGKLMEKGLDILAIGSKYSELVSRATEYINARKAGKPQIVAMEEAGRVTAPFHHTGKLNQTFFKMFIKGLPFFNASLQVLDQHLRTMNTPKGRTRTGAMLTMITAGYIASLTSLIRADDEQREQYKDLKPEELANFLYFPHPSGKRLIRVKMSTVFSPLGAIINMIIADEVLQTRYTTSDYINAATSILPEQFDLTEPVKAFFAWMPQVFQAGAETIIGVKTWPEVTPLESAHLKRLPPGLRTNNNTSAFAKFLGEQTNLSPIKIDHFLTGYLGRSIGLATGRPSAWDFDSSVIRDYWFASGRRVGGTYDLREENNREYGQYQRGEIELSKEQETEVYRVKVFTDDFIDIIGEYRKLDIEEKPTEAAELRSEAIQIINQLEDSTAFPKGFKKWSRLARKRRRKNLKDKK